MQKRLIEYDWLWKVLVYGSYLDFNFLKRLKNDYKTIKDKTTLLGQGITIGDKNKKYDASKYIGKNLINHNTDIEQYNVMPSLEWKEKNVTRERNKELFKAPVLLVKQSLDANMMATTAISYSNTLYRQSKNCNRSSKN